MRYVSLFSGIEAASVAWGPLGWEPVAFAEIEPFPCAVLAQRFPDVPNLGDVTQIDWEEFKQRYGAVDLICGGSPCQSFSIAGGRESLDGESRLMFEYIRAVQELRPRWFVWENVPGVLNTRDDAFGCFLDQMDESGYSTAWRVLDAQFFGVAQRRRRVWAIGASRDAFGDIAAGRAAAVLFERDSVRGNTQSSREKRAALAAVAQSDVGTCRGGGRLVDDALCMAGNIVGRSENAGPAWGNGINDDISFTLNTADRHAVSYALNRQIIPEHGTAQGPVETFELTPTLGASTNTHAVMCMQDGQAHSGIDSDVSTTLNAAHEQPIVCMGSDSSKAAIDEDVAGTLHVGGGVADDCCGPLCARDYKGVGNQYVREGKLICERRC